MFLSAVAALLAAALAVPTAGRADIGNVNAVGTVFVPAVWVVSANASFTFSNIEALPISILSHTLTSGVAGPDGKFDSFPCCFPGFAATLTAPSTSGSYPFFCRFHPWMRGVLIVR